MRLPHFRLGLCLLVASCASAATTAPPTPFEERVELLFRAPLGEMMALSPDGRHVAFTRQAGEELQVILLQVDNPQAKFTLNVDEARAMAFSAEKQRARLRFLRWATANRLVLAPIEERITFPDQQSKIIAPIFAVDADGQNPKTLVEAEDFALPQEGPPEAAPRFIPRNPQILGFEPGRRDELLLRLPAVPRLAPPELLSLNVRTGKIVSLDAGQIRGANDGRLPATPAQRDELTRELAKKFPQREIALLDWSEGLQHVLVRVTGGSDPGRVFVLQRPFNLLLEICRTAPWLKSSDLNATRLVQFELAPHVRLSGHLTLPRTARLKPPPLLVSFPDGFPGRTRPDFDPEAQVFADLGFAVLRLNHRYARNVPADERELARTAIDRISVEDAAAMIQRAAALPPGKLFDVKHVAAIGRGFGGYLATRALQLRPDVFRAGVAIDAPMDLRAWLHPVEGPAGRDIPLDLFSGDGVAWSKLSVRDNIASLKQPVFFLVEPARNRTIEAGVDSVISALKKAKQPPEFLELDPAFNQALPKTRAAVYRRIEEFFNLRLYDYRVKIGPATEVK